MENLKVWHKAFAKEYTYQSCVVGVLAGCVIAFYGLLSYAFPDHELTPQVLSDSLGAWSIWLLVIGALMAIMCGYFLSQVMERMDRFMELMDTNSKKKFRENLEKLDSLAYYHLPERFSRRLQKQKERFSIK